MVNMFFLNESFYIFISKEWVLTFTNTSRLPVQFLEVSLDSSSQDGMISLV